MEKDLQLYETIDQYISGSLEGEALKSFEERLSQDSELQKEVALQRRMDNVYEDLPKQDLRAKLKQLREKHDNSNIGEQAPKQAKIRTFFRGRNLSLIAAALTLLVVSTVVLNNLLSDPAFSKNVALETQLGDTDESDGMTFTIDPSYLGNTYRLSDKGDLNLQIKGELKVADLNKDERLVMKVFNNKNELITIDSNQTSDLPIALDRSQDSSGNLAFGDNPTYPFQSEQKLALEKGLYYFIITFEGEEDVLYVGKFKVKE